MRFPGSSAEATLKSAWKKYFHGHERNCCRLLFASYREFKEQENKQKERRQSLAADRARRASLRASVAVCRSALRPCTIRRSRPSAYVMTTATMRADVA